ncbi:MAG TPA: cyclic nucleotide-binding domain-containing protein [Actinomycetota bacterium]|jgi:cAMP-dependent protein kinase regulator|nr:cyclic nucleotide-binding domain-containing protein [Actinomycetota bacterium]
MPRGIPKEVIQHFQAVPLFGAVSAKSLRSIVQAATEVDVQAGKVLVREGEWGREMYVILRGTAEVTRDGRRLRELVPGDFFGEMAFLSPAPRTATVTARSDMRVMVLDSRAMGGVVEKEPAVARRLLSAMADRIRATERSASH